MSNAPTLVRRRVDAESTVLIASEHLLSTWSSIPARPTDLLTLADEDAQQAIDVIRMRRPQIVILEQTFVASARGATLVDNLRSNADLADLEIRILPAKRSAVLGASGPITGRLLASVARSLRHWPSRRARRYPMPAGAEIAIDGERAALIDVSALGAQVVAPSVLRPNQTVEAVVERSGIVLRVRAEIAWSSLELAQGKMTYRAGMAFANAVPRLLQLAPGR